MSLFSWSDVRYFHMHCRFDQLLVPETQGASRLRSETWLQPESCVVVSSESACPLRLRALGSSPVDTGGQQYNHATVWPSGIRSQDGGKTLHNAVTRRADSLKDGEAVSHGSAVRIRGGFAFRRGGFALRE